MTIKVQGERSDEARCGFCRDDFSAEESLACPECRTLYHEECWQDELGGHCATLGCVNEKPAQGPRAMRLLRNRLGRRRRRRRLQQAREGGPASATSPARSALGLACALMLAAVPFFPSRPNEVVVVWLVLIVAILGATFALARQRLRARADAGDPEQGEAPTEPRRRRARW